MAASETTDVHKPEIEGLEAKIAMTIDATLSSEILAQRAQSAGISDTDCFLEGQSAVSLPNPSKDPLPTGTVLHTRCTVLCASPVSSRYLLSIIERVRLLETE